MKILFMSISKKLAENNTENSAGYSTENTAEHSTENSASLVTH